MSIASNTKECFSEFIGLEVKGVLFDILPLGDKKISNGTKTLIFSDGRGLTISNSGTFWIESKENIDSAIHTARATIDILQKGIENVLRLSGEKN